MAQQKILVGIPMYNCEKQIARVIADFALPNPLWTQHDFELLVIDNRSSDASFLVAENALKDLPIPSHLVKNKINAGLGGSQKKAFQWAQENNFDFLVILHGDHQATTSEIGDLLKQALNNPSAAAILGSRFSFNSRRRGYSLVRILGNLGLNTLYTLLTGKKIADLGSGLNLFRVRQMDLHRVRQYSNGFTFNMDLLLDLIRTKRSFTFVPITWTDFDQVSNARNFKVGWTALKTLLLWRFQNSKEPPVSEENLISTFEEIVTQKRKT
jgi:glycosyltransferase involved in cell wall biosynthesis